jgi:hypothetical protein
MSILSISDETNRISSPEPRVNELGDDIFGASIITQEIGLEPFSAGHEIDAANNILIQEYCR